MYCFTCGGSGLVGKVCPECGHLEKGIKRREEIQLKAKEIKVTENTGEFSTIPDVYEGVFWQRNRLEKDHLEKLPEKFGIEGTGNDRMFEHWVNQLSKLDAIFSTGKIPNKSVYVVAPPGYGKTVFAYSCMQYALASGFSVAPMIDTVELKRLLLLAAENLDYKLYGKFSYDDWVGSDVVWVTVTHTYYRYQAYTALEELINRRARLGLSTFVVSRYSIDTLYKWDKFGSLDSLKNSESRDGRKYPAVLMYTEKRGV